MIKHGIKASGMPAWGKNMGDEYIWNMAAFLQVLPTLDATAYKELVDSSEGHSHGGGETQGHHDDEKAEDHPAPSEPGNNSMPHAHPPGVDDDHHGPTLSDTEVGLVDHRHPNGKVESHPAPHTPVAGDGHAHTH
ncbi:cytochrome c [Xanthomonadaceae bacterium XH05]|nr:cytochrome c [Xanthomonadaceae bacterium XH05]